MGFSEARHKCQIVLYRGTLNCFIREAGDENSSEKKARAVNYTCYSVHKALHELFLWEETCESLFSAWFACV